MNATAETIIRRYMRALTDPTVLVDDDEITRITAELETADDPIDRLRLQQRLIDTSTPDMDGATRDFVSIAAPWAKEHGITTQAFRAEGVPADVLRQAGLTVPTSKSATRKGRGRPKRVSRDDIRKQVPAGPFTAAELIDRTGASPATVRAAIGELLDAGRIQSAGTDPDHPGPGRAPLRYQLA